MFSRVYSDEILAVPASIEIPRIRIPFTIPSPSPLISSPCKVQVFKSTSLLNVKGIRLSTRQTNRSIRSKSSNLK